MLVGNHSNPFFLRTVLQAQKELLKLKNVVKLQAAVRGYLVRQHAIGTLRCVRAIVKMQALVRARRARLSPESSYVENEVGGKHGKPISKTSVMVLNLNKNVLTTGHCLYKGFCLRVQIDKWFGYVDDAVLAQPTVQMK